MIKVSLPFKTCTINDTKFRAYPDGRLERWFKEKWNQVEVTPRIDGYSRVKCNGLNYLYHRVIYVAFNPGWDINDSSSFIDHIDRNPLNNAINNLRIASATENSWNSTNTSIRKYVGLTKNILPYYDKKSNKWYWRIRVRIGNGKRKSKGIYGGDGPIPIPLPPVPDDVLKARDDFVKIHHGEFAN